MDAKRFFEEIGGSYEDAFYRFGSDQIITLFVSKYANDKTFDALASAVSSGDIRACYEAAHSLKGVAGNMGFIKLFNCVSALTEQLRPQTAPADPALFEAVCAEQERILAAAGHSG